MPSQSSSRLALPMPTGWFVVAFSHDLAPGAVQIVEAFGQELVLYRSESGEARLVDPFCAHLGAHLGHGGVVVGERLRCPFHAWEFDGSGRCAHVPYAEKIPPKAKLKTWPLREVNGLLFTWYDAKGAEPSWEVPELEEEGWHPDRYVTWRIRSNPQEIAENTVDIQHLGPVHGAFPKQVSKAERHGPMLEVHLQFDAPGEVVDMPDITNSVEMEVFLYGLGYLEVQTEVTTAGVSARQRILSTPVSADEVWIRGTTSIRYLDDAAMSEEVAELFHIAFEKDFPKDFPIWENKKYLHPPVLAAGDGPIGIYRKWARQFYPEVSAQPEITAEAPAAAPSGAQLLHRARDVGRTLLSRWRPQDEAPPATPKAAAPRKRKLTVRRPPPPPGPPISSVREYFDGLDARFVPEEAEGVDAVIQWRISGESGGDFHAVLRGGALQVHAGVHDTPSVDIQIGDEDYVRMVNGEVDGTRLFATGRGKVSGNVRLAMKMKRIFPAAG